MKSQQNRNNNSVEKKIPIKFRKSDLKKYSFIISELLRCYNENECIKNFSWLKENFNPNFKIPPYKLNLRPGWTGEVLAKNDPRGMTIGCDIGHNLMISGKWDLCVKAGFSKPAYGFFVLYHNGRITAQSLLYVNKKIDAKTIICNCIETNIQNNQSEIIERYQDFFSKYLKFQLRRGYEFSQIHVGDIGLGFDLSHLKKVKSIPMPNNVLSIKTKSQFCLLKIEKKEIAFLKNIKSEVNKPSNWKKIKKEIMKVEISAFKEKGYSERDLEKEFTNPKGIVIIIKDGAKIIGYSTSYPWNKRTLYISSTAIAVDYQGRGIVGDIKYLMDNEAIKRGYLKYVVDANVDNGYADSLKKQYTVIEEKEPFISRHGTQQRLKLKIKDHRPPISL